MRTRNQPMRTHSRDGAAPVERKCPACGELLATAQQLGIHRRSSHGVAGKWADQHGRRDFLCPDCGLPCKTPRSVSVHRARVHKIYVSRQHDSDLARKASTRHVRHSRCRECGVWFETERTLRAHVARYHREPITTGATA